MTEYNNYPYKEMTFADIIGTPEIRDTPDGMYATARCYLDGKGVEPNYEAYLEYLNQAASMGSWRAKEELEEIEGANSQEEEPVEEEIQDTEDGVWDHFDNDLDDDLADDFNEDYDMEDTATIISDESENTSSSVQTASSEHEQIPHSTDLSQSDLPSYDITLSAAEKLESYKTMANVDLYEAADDDNPYACFEIFLRNKDGGDQARRLADQCLDKASTVAEQNGDLDFCRIIFKEAGEYYANKNVNKSLEYSGKASELGDTSASLRLARYYLSNTNGRRDEAQGLRYLDLAGNGNTDEETYEIGKAYIECGRPLKGKSLIARLLKKENINQNLWFTCALECPEFTTPEETIRHAWAVEDFTVPVKEHLLNYYKNQSLTYEKLLDVPDSLNSPDLNPERTFLLAKWEREFNGTSGPWMQRAAGLGIQEAIDTWNADQEENKKNEKEKARIEKEKKQKQVKEKKADTVEEKRGFLKNTCLVLLFIVAAIGSREADYWASWLLDIIVLLLFFYLFYGFLESFRIFKSFRIITAAVFIVLGVFVIHDFFVGISFITCIMRLISLALTFGWAIFRYDDIYNSVQSFISNSSEE